MEVMEFQAEEAVLKLVLLETIALVMAVQV
jgi:hypothetical protein